jgi:iron(III) transport system permease protein
VGRALSFRLGSQATALVAAGAVVVLVCGAPFLGLALQLVGGAGGAEPSAAVRLLAAPATWSLLATSTTLAAGVTAAALAVGVPLGILLGRTDLRARRALLMLHALPLFLPPFLVALGAFHLVGREGLIGGELTSRWLFGPAGVVLVEGICFTPVVTLLAALAAGAIDPSLLEAARLQARPRQVATGILAPLVVPAASLGALAVFALAFSEVGVPMFLRVRTYPAAVFTRLGGIDYAPGEAVALAAPLVALALVLAMAERWLGTRRPVHSLGLRAGQQALLPLGAQGAPLALAAGAMVALSGLPVLALAARAGARGFGGVWGWMGNSLGASLGSAAGAATVIVSIGLVVGHALRQGGASARWLDGLAVFAFVAPAGLLGVGQIAAWNRPATTWVYGSMLVLVLGLAGRYLVLGERFLAVSFAQRSPHLEEAACAAGASYWRRLVRILVPVHGRAVAACWLISLVFCLRDLDTVVLFYPPGLAPLTVRIFTLEANGPPATVAALAVLQVVVTALLLAGGVGLLGGRRARP